VYYRKLNNVHRGLGVFPVNEEQEKYLVSKYNRGAQCGYFGEGNVVQYAVQNLLLLDGHKFHIRVYLFIASANPLIAYFHDGYARIAVNKYDEWSSDFNTFVTNRGITKEASAEGRKESPFQNMTEAEVLDITCFYFSRIQEQLIKENKTNDTKWLDNHFRPELKKVMVHLLRMSQQAFLPYSSSFQFYGVDFVMDQNLNPWFIEANGLPSTDGWSPTSNQFFKKLLHDIFEVVFGLLKSRMKRVIGFVQELEKRKPLLSANSPDLEIIREQYLELLKNKFNDQFKPHPNNGLQLIVDGNLNGVARYMNLIPEECL